MIDEILSAVSLLPAMLRDISKFAFAVIDHWATLATGGVIMGIIAFLDSIERPVRKRLIFWTFICFLGVSFFLAWRDENHGRITAETDRNSFSNSLVALQGRFDGISDALAKANALNKAQAATIATQISSNAAQSPQIQGNENPISYGAQSYYQQGGITANSLQVSGDLIVQGKRPIESISMMVTLESDTSSNQVEELMSSSGVGVTAAIFTDDKTRIRFLAQDRAVKSGQISQNKRIMTCLLTPEAPSDILGKNIDFLKTVHTFVVRFSDYPDVHGWPKDEPRKMKLAITINGIEAASSPFIDIPRDVDIGSPKQLDFTVGPLFESAADNYKQLIMQAK
jgi:hypothetical protein